MKTSTSISIIPRYRRHWGPRAGVLALVLLDKRCGVGVLVPFGESSVFLAAGVRCGESSAFLMNCSGVRGEPGEPLEWSEWGLAPLGVCNSTVGPRGLGSGVLGGPVVCDKGSSGSSVGWVSRDTVNVAELIHFGSAEPNLGGEGIRSRR